MLISFALPAFKGEFFEKAVRSILSQSYAELELVVLDDASPDDIAGILAKFPDPRVRYARNLENLGGKDLVANWMRCLEMCRGEYVVLAGDDDEYGEDFCAEMVAVARKHPELAVMHGRLIRIDEDSKITGVSSLASEVESVIDYLWHFKDQSRILACPDVMFKMSALRSIGGIVKLPLAWGSDLATWLLLAKQAGIGYSQNALLHWRYSGRNISSQKWGYEKVQARETYQDWINEFARTLTPANPVERYQLDEFLTWYNRCAPREIAKHLANNAVADIARAYRAAGKHGRFKHWLKRYALFMLAYAVQQRVRKLFGKN